MSRLLNYIFLLAFVWVVKNTIIFELLSFYLLNKPSDIPIFSLHEEAKFGFFINQVGLDLQTTGHNKWIAHRDDHYLFFLIESGSSNILVDFQVYSFTGPNFCLIHPNQVHCAIDYQVNKGWAMGFDSSLIFPDVISSLDRLSVSSQLLITPELLDTQFELCKLLWQAYQKPNQSRTIQYLLNALLSVSLDAIVQSSTPTLENRGDRLTEAFRQLVKKHYAAWKRPAQYAEALHITVNHLNDTVKQRTGFSLSYWIQYENVLEARKLLYHTSLPIKEIAFQVGYEDPHYFSRLFTKVSGYSPGAFRKIFHDSSTLSH
ncbi:MAG: helix-turn-helix transcriptional regulator [Siphonobacter sp.]